jgi:hypothetical protein
MSTFQTDFAAAKTAIIKAFEHDYTPSFHALLQRLVEYFKLHVLLEPTRQWQHLYNLVSETLRKEPFTYVLTVFFEIQFLAMYIVKKTFDYFMPCVTMAYGSVVYGMSYVFDTPEKTNIAVNVIALNVFVFFCWWLVSLVCGYAFPSTALTVVERCLVKAPSAKSRRKEKRASRRPGKSQIH